jgi:predicted site-specific integrase-resolvase
MHKSRDMPKKPAPTLIGSAEVCEWARIDRSTLSRHIAAGKITPAHKLPGRTGSYLFERNDVAVYIATIRPERVA